LCSLPAGRCPRVASACERLTPPHSPPSHPAGEADCRAVGHRDVPGGDFPQLGHLGRVERKVPRRRAPLHQVRGLSLYLSHPPTPPMHRLDCLLQLRQRHAVRVPKDPTAPRQRPCRGQQRACPFVRRAHVVIPEVIPKSHCTPLLNPPSCRGDAGMKPGFATRLAGSADLYHVNGRCVALPAYLPTHACPRTGVPVPPLQRHGTFTHAKMASRRALAHRTAAHNTSASPTPVSHARMRPCALDPTPLTDPFRPPWSLQKAVALDQLHHRA
jgi:hypothetical protein